jgi:hypothetical protein
MELVRLHRSAAQSYLAGKGFSPTQQAGILNATHCTPPESYLIIASEQILKPNSWMHLGLWDLRRALLVKRLRFLPQAETLTDLTARFGYAEGEAAALYSQAQAIASEGQERNFIAPSQGFLSLRWLPCQPQPDTGKMVCPVGMAINWAGSVLETFSYDPAIPSASHFHFRHPEGLAVEGTPGVVVWADGQKLEPIVLPAPAYPDLGVMVDLPNQRIIIGSPPLVQSMFVQLLYLNGRYAEHYEKFDEQATYLGTRVVTWKIHWEGSRSAAANQPAAPRNQRQPSALHLE